MDQPGATSSSSGSNVWKFIGCGCLALLLLGGLGSFGFVYGLVKLLKNNDPYKDSIAAVQGNPAAIEALGEPIEPGWWLTGSINLSNDTGTADFTIPVSGPKGKGTIRVIGSKASSATGWGYSTWELRVRGKPDPIPLGN